MLSALLSGLNVGIGGGGEDGEFDDRGGVVLRAEQIKVVLFEGKDAIASAELHQSE